MEQPGQYRYYAFISYSRKDERWARWLQRRLETYHLPASVRREHKIASRRLAPVFRDKTDLASGPLEDALQQELAQSKYLVVICSPNSAASIWVDREVQSFIRMGREERIIPFIVSGQPYGANGQPECFPPALRESVQKELLGISVAEYGKLGAFLRVAAAMLDVRYDELYKRHMRRRRRNSLLAAMLGLCVLAGAGAAAWYYTPHSAYYADYVMRWEIPEGIYPLTDSQREGLYSSWRIVTQKGKVIRLERVNAAGTPVEAVYNAGGGDHPITEFVYDSGGALSRAEMKDKHGQTVMRKVYSIDRENRQIAVDLQQPYTSSQAMTMESGEVHLDDVDVSVRSAITRQLNTYDENGLLIQTLYRQDTLNRPAHDQDGVYGIAYERNELGQPLRETYLGEDGTPYRCRNGWAGYHYAYDGQGRLESLMLVDEEGEPIPLSLAKNSLVYDERGNLCTIFFLDGNGRPGSNANGIYQAEFQYDSRGFLTGTYFFDQNGEPVYESNNSLCGATYERDEWGRTIRETYLDADGQPTYCWSEDCAAIQVAYDEQGREISRRYFGPDGEPTLIAGTYAGIDRTYDENGYLRSSTFLDADGAPINRWAFTTAVYDNDSNGNVLRASLYGADGELIDHGGYAVAEYTYDEMGNRTGASYQYAYTERTVNNGEDELRDIRWEYDNGHLTAESYYGEDGVPIEYEGYHRVEYAYDEYANLTTATYYSTDGRQVYLRRDDYAVCRMEYDSFGNLVDTAYYDADGEPFPYYDGQYLYWRLEDEYDRWGNDVRQVLCGEGDTEPTLVIERTFDDRNNIIRMSYRDKNGQPMEDNDGVSTYLWDYNDKNLCVCGRYLDADGSPCTILDGVCTIRWQYNEKGQQIAALYYVPGPGGRGEELDYQIVTEYGERGFGMGDTYLDGEGNVLKYDMPPLAVEVLKVEENSPAEQHGVQAGDFIVAWNDWCCFDYEKNSEVVDSFNEIFEQSRQQRRTVTMARPVGDGQFQFMQYTMEPGAVWMMHIGDDSHIGEEEVRAMEKAYMAWLEEEK